MGSAFDAVLFDLDDTLVEYERGQSELLAAAFADVGVDPFFDAAEYVRRYDDFADDAEGVNELRRNCFSTIAAERGRDPEIGRAVADAFAAERDHTRVRLLPGALDALDAVSDFRVGLVTNGAREMQRQKIEGAGLDDHFETVVYAGADTPSKPHPAPFHRATADLGVTPERTLHVGNSLSSDVAGAHAAGVRSAWVPASDETPDPVPDFSFANLREFAARSWTTE